MKVFANVNKYSLFRSLNIFLMMKTLPRVRCAQQKSRMIKMRLERMTGSWPSFTQYSMIFKIRFVIPLIVVTVWTWYKQSGNYCRMFICKRFGTPWILFLISILYCVEADKVFSHFDKLS